MEKGRVFFSDGEVRESNCNNSIEVLRTKQICDASLLSTREVKAWQSRDMKG